VEIDPPLIGRGDQFVGFPFADRLGGSPEIGPALFELNEGLRMKPLRFGAIVRAEAPLFLSLAKEWTQIVGDPLAKPIDTGLGMFPGTCHRKGHVYHQCVPLWRLEPLILHKFLKTQ